MGPLGHVGTWFPIELIPEEHNRNIEPGPPQYIYRKPMNTVDALNMVFWGSTYGSPKNLATKPEQAGSRLKSCVACVVAPCRGRL